MPSPVFAVLWYAACVIGAYIWVGGDAGLSSLLASPLERAAAAVAVGTVRVGLGGREEREPLSFYKGCRARVSWRLRPPGARARAPPVEIPFCPPRLLLLLPRAGRARLHRLWPLRLPVYARVRMRGCAGGRLHARAFAGARASAAGERGRRPLFTDAQPSLLAAAPLPPPPPPPPPPLPTPMPSTHPDALCAPAARPTRAGRSR